MNNQAVAKVTFRQKVSKMGNNLSLILAWIILAIILTCVSPYFLTIDNLMNILLLSAITLIRASGATIAMITGGLDLSQHSIGAVTGVVMATMALQLGTPLWVLIPLAIVMGILMGLVNSTLISVFKIVPMIATLGTMQIYRGFAWIICDKTVMVSNQSMLTMGRGRILQWIDATSGRPTGGIPIIALIALVFFFLAVFVLRYTTFGRKIYMIGGNENASYLSGINANKIKFVAYLISAVCASFAGFASACQVGAALPQSGDGTEMATISAIILGGLSLSGGKGSMLGTLLGILVLQTINNGLTLLSVNSYVQMVVTGTILILAVMLDVIRSGALKKK